jgi:hypothetical protein
MNSKIITLVILAVIIALVWIFPGDEPTIKSSGKPKALKSQGLLLGALAILGIF